MNTNFENEYNELQLSVSESVAALSLIMDAIDQDCADRSSDAIENRVAFATHLSERLSGIYEPALSMVYRNLSDANDRAAALLKEMAAQ